MFDLHTLRKEQLRSPFVFVFLLAVVGFAVVTWSPSSAFAWRAESCQGKIHAGLHNAKTLYATTISFPDGSAARDTLESAVREWNQLYGMYDRINIVYDDFSTISTGNGRSEIAFVSDSATDGSRATASLRHEPCLSLFGNLADGEVDEFDIRLNVDTVNSGDADIGWQYCDTNAQSSIRGTIVHEIGHVLGMKHDDHPYTVMHSSRAAYGDTHGKYCNPFSEYAPHPDDADFAFKYHNSGNTSKDVALSNHYTESPDQTSLIDDPSKYEPYTELVCPGEEVSFAFGFGFRGTEGVRDYWLVLLSLDRSIDSSDTVVKTGWLTGGSGAYGLVYFQDWAYFRVPETLEEGTDYYILIETDYDRSVYEVNQEDNNLLRMPKRIRLSSFC